MYEVCPYCGSERRELRTVVGHVVTDGRPESNPTGSWFRCLHCGADYGEITWNTSDIGLGNRWAPEGRRRVRRSFDFVITDKKPRAHIRGTLNEQREIVTLQGTVI